MRGHSMRRHILSFLLTLVILSSLLAGCAQSSADAEEYEFTIGVSINSLRSPYMIALSQGITETGEELGIRMIVSESNGDIQTQANQVLDFIVQDVDAVLIEPLDAEASAALVDRVTEAGIPVFCIDTSSESDNVVCWVGADSYEMGQLAAEYIVEALYEKYGAYEGKVVDLLASLTTTSGSLRTQGFHDVIDQYPDIEVVATQNGGLDLDTAMDAMTDILQANPDIDAVWCSGDTNAQGALQALKRAGMLYTTEEEDHIILVSADGAPESLEAIAEGYLDACISQNPIGEGEAAVEIIYEYLTEGTLPDELFYSYPLFTITAENLDSEELEEYGIWAYEIEY